MTAELTGLLALMILSVLLLLATREDMRSHRIPNRLVLAGVVLGLALNGLLPGGLGWLAALKGLALGLAVLLPIYLLRAMGAGDVKLMGMVGAFLGAGDLIGALIATLIAGGVMALVAALWSRQFLNLLLNIRGMLLGGLLRMSTGRPPLMNDMPLSVGQLPYAVAITTGTLGYLVWQRM
ncbi:A24 family peptidase [Methylotenera sp. G11]|uniref:A24 family peptidase n=1 Tax=Methylotenera sp. G11 TaxID=1506585 RepID=UPI0006466F41|nr:prepilin peptidase [Methylotenera sp. G11]